MLAATTHTRRVPTSAAKSVPRLLEIKRSAAVADSSSYAAFRRPRSFLPITLFSVRRLRRDVMALRQTMLQASRRPPGKTPSRKKKKKKTNNKKKNLTLETLECYGIGGLAMGFHPSKPGLPFNLQLQEACCLPPPGPHPPNPAHLSLVFWHNPVRVTNLEEWPRESRCGSGTAGPLQLTAPHHRSKIRPTPAGCLGAQHSWERCPKSASRKVFASIRRQPHTEFILPASGARLRPCLRASSPMVFRAQNSDAITTLFPGLTSRPQTPHTGRYLMFSFARRSAFRWLHAGGGGFGPARFAPGSSERQPVEAVGCAPYPPRTTVMPPRERGQPNPYDSLAAKISVLPSV